jgi:surface antigen
MLPLLLNRTLTSFKKEIAIVLGVVGGIAALPFVALLSTVNVSALNDPAVTIYTGPASTTNTYMYGYCTFWAAKRREEIGKPIPNNWGDAHTWDDRAVAAGYMVNHQPAQNAIMETDAGPLGHVAFVESVAADGSWKISEMNFKGWDQVDTRTLKASDAAQYNFIH